MNARIQGLDKLARGFQANRMGFVMKGLMLATISAALMLAGKDDKRYQDLEEWDRDTNWHFFAGDVHVRIPKPFEVGAIFGTSAERLVRWGTGDDTKRASWDAFTRFLGSTLQFNAH
jgi:hypothetical protein